MINHKQKVRTVYYIRVYKNIKIIASAKQWSIYAHQNATEAEYVIIRDIKQKKYRYYIL